MHRETVQGGLKCLKGRDLTSWNTKNSSKNIYGDNRVWHNRKCFHWCGEHLPSVNLAGITNCSYIILIERIIHFFTPPLKINRIALVWNKGEVEKKIHTLEEIYTTTKVPVGRYSLNTWPIQVCVALKGAVLQPFKHSASEILLLSAFRGESDNKSACSSAQSILYIVTIDR